MLASAFRSSSHERFASVGPELLLPVARLIDSHAAWGVEDNASLADTAADVRARGRSWVLLGAARLALVVPSAGTDPARKAALEQRRLRDFVDRELQPEIEVRGGNAGLADAMNEGTGRLTSVEHVKHCLTGHFVDGGNVVAGPTGVPCAEVTSMRQCLHRMAAGPRAVSSAAGRPQRRGARGCAETARCRCCRPS